MIYNDLFNLLTNKMIGKKRSNQKKMNKAESFLSKLHDILSDNNYNEIIHWDTDGRRIIICDVNNLCNVVLPKFYKHHNYSSFVRQLNMYGFHKSKGLITNGERYEHESFNKNSSKDEINQIIRQSKKMKVLAQYIKSNQKEDPTNESEFLTNCNEDDVLKYLFEKNEENQKNSIALKKELEELRNENYHLNQEIAMFKSVLNSHKILLQKILMKNDESHINDKKSKKNSSNLNDLFKKYLYFLRIYSPYVTIKNKDVIKQKTEKDDDEIQGKTQENDVKEPFDDIVAIKSNVNNYDSFIDEISVFNYPNDFHIYDLNLSNNYSSRNFSRVFK